MRVSLTYGDTDTTTIYPEYPAGEAPIGVAINGLNSRAILTRLNKLYPECVVDLLSPHRASSGTV